MTYSSYDMVSTTISNFIYCTDYIEIKLRTWIELSLKQILFEQRHNKWCPDYRNSLQFWEMIAKKTEDFLKLFYSNEKETNMFNSFDRIIKMQATKKKKGT